MKKSILNLKGAQELTKNEQKSVNGGMPGEVCLELGKNGLVVVCYKPKNCLLHPSGYSYCG